MTPTDNFRIVPVMHDGKPTYALQRAHTVREHDAEHTRWEDVRVTLRLQGVTVGRNTTLYTGTEKELRNAAAAIVEQEEEERTASRMRKEHLKQAPIEFNPKEES